MTYGTKSAPHLTIGQYYAAAWDGELVIRTDFQFSKIRSARRQPFPSHSA